MCQTSTCLPTPEQVHALVRRGLGARLATFAFAPDPERYRCIGPAPAGQEGSRGLSHTRAGPCTFFKSGHCELHEDGKPLEGQLARHDRPWLPIRLHVLEQWTRSAFDSARAALDAPREVCDA